MREILFRGKRIDNGEWIEGHYGEYMLMSGEPIACISIPNKEAVCGSTCCDVEASTVGQYTGLTDKNGKKIFEGDILSIAQMSNGLGDYYYPPIKYPVNVIVRWDLCAWMWQTIEEQKFYLTFPDAWCHYESEVIGNIHDNPELLEVTK